MSKKNQAEAGHRKENKFCVWFRVCWNLRHKGYAFPRVLKQQMLRHLLPKGNCTLNDHASRRRIILKLQKDAKSAKSLADGFLQHCTCYVPFSARVHDPPVLSLGWPCARLYKLCVCVVSAWLHCHLLRLPETCWDLVTCWDLTLGSILLSGPRTWSSERTEVTLESRSTCTKPSVELRLKKDVPGCQGVSPCKDLRQIQHLLSSLLL